MKDCSPFCEKSILHHNGSQIEEEKVDSAAQTNGTSPVLQYFQDFWSDKMDLSMLAYGVLVSVLMALVTFTFFGAVDFGDGRKLMPILWSSYFPEPFTMISIHLDQDSVW